MDPTESKLEFVLRVADEFQGTLNAASAIYRAESLTGDAVRMGEAYKKQPPESVYSKWRSFQTDLVSYYAVGFVTCLEWHARSRLVDLFTYMPDVLREDDLKKDLSAKNLSRLIGAKASIPQFVAATRNFSTAEAYTAVFARLFAALKIEPDARSIVSKIDVEPAVFALRAGGLQDLFEFRNMLVHEINETHIGHPNFHEYWDFDVAIKVGNFVVSIMKALEQVLSLSAPRDFPNKLTTDGRAVDLDEELENQIREVEEVLSTKLEAFPAACTVSRQAIEAENDMLCNSHELHMRWLDLRAAPRRTLRVGRLKYLKTLAEALELAPERSEPSG